MLVVLAQQCCCFQSQSELNARSREAKSSGQVLANQHKRQQWRGGAQDQKPLMNRGDDVTCHPSQVSRISVSSAVDHIGWRGQWVFSATVICSEVYFLTSKIFGVTCLKWEIKMPQLYKRPAPSGYPMRTCLQIGMNIATWAFGYLPTETVMMNSWPSKCCHFLSSPLYKVIYREATQPFMDKLKKQNTSYSQV